MGLQTIVRQAQAKLDAEIAIILDDCRQQEVALYCRRGCANCCRLAVHAIWPEAAALAAVLDDRQLSALQIHVARLRQQTDAADGMLDYLRQHRNSLDGCPFLDADGACGVYTVRPLSCRALHSTRPGDWCGIDLSALPALDKDLYLRSLDPDLVDFPTHFLARPRAVARQLEETVSFAMRKQYGFAIDGNLTILVWLVREQRLDSHFDRGRAVVETLLQDLKLPPWLVRLVDD